MTIVTVRLDELLKSTSKPPENDQQHIIYAKLSDLVTDTSAKLTRESREGHRLTYRFAPYLVDVAGTDTGGTNDNNIFGVHTPSPPPPPTNQLTNNVSLAKLTALWSTDQKTGSGGNDDVDLISFENEKEDPLAFILALNAGQQVHPHETLPSATPSPVVLTDTKKPSPPKQHRQMQTFTYGPPPAKVPLFKPPQQLQQQHYTVQASTYSPSIKVPLFRPPPQQQQPQTPATGKVAPSDDDIGNRIAEKLAQHSSFKLPSKSIVTLKRPPGDTNAPSSPSSSSPSSPSSTSSPSSFNAKAAPFIPSSTTTVSSSSPLNVKAPSFTPTTATPTETKPASPPTNYNVNAAPFIPATMSTPPIATAAPAPATGSLLDLQSEDHKEQTAPHDPPILDASAPEFVPSSRSSPLNAEATAFTPSKGSGNETALEAGLALLNITAMPLTPIMTSRRNSDDDDNSGSPGQLNPSAPVFEPTTTVSSSSSSLPLLHPSSTSSCISTDDDHHHHFPTYDNNNTTALPKADTLASQHPSDTDLINLTMESFTDSRVAW